MDFISKSLGKMMINIDFMDVCGLNLELKGRVAKKLKFAFKMSFFQNRSF